MSCDGSTTSARRGSGSLRELPHPVMGLSGGERLYLAGDRPKALFRLQRGMLRLVRTKPDGHSVTLRHVLPGDVFGEEAVTGQARHTGAVAALPTILEVIDPRDADLMQVVASLVEQAGRMMSLGYDLHVGNLRKRVARYLLRLADTPLATRDAEGRCVLHVTHAMVAEGTGSIRESASQELSNLRREGLIRTAYREIALLDEQELDGIAHESLLD